MQNLKIVGGGGTVTQFGWGDWSISLPSSAPNTLWDWF